MADTANIVSLIMTRYKKHNLHCVDESFAVKASCANGTVCRFWVTTPSVVKGWLERCFAVRVQRKDWAMCKSMVGNTHPDDIGGQSGADLLLPLAKGEHESISQTHRK